VQLFAIKMLAGIVAGTYSSIFIAGLIYYQFIQKRDGEHLRAEVKKVDKPTEGLA
jgi:preprotein translocase subunit SecF